MTEGVASWRLGHRPALDGLRGIAILLVLLEHTGAPAFATTGSIGVFLFFTLSGFLITALLLDEHRRSGRVDFRRFYARRIRRLAPGLVVVVGAVGAVGLFLGPWWLSPSDVPAALLYYANWVEIQPGASLHALAMTWSLSVEEQFYLLWPTAVAALAARRRVVVVAMVLASASLLWRFVLFAQGATFDRIAYGSDTVAVALFAGAAVAGLRTAGGAGRSRSVALGAVAVGVCWVASWDPRFVVLLGLPVVAVLAATAVWFSTGTGPVWVLEGRWLGWLGSRSYGIYLWHAPLLWALRTHYGAPWQLVAGVGLPVSLALAELSYRFVESPWRARREIVAVDTDSVSGVVARR